MNLKNTKKCSKKVLTKNKKEYKIRAEKTNKSSNAKGGKNNEYIWKKRKCNSIYSK